MPANVGEMFYTGQFPWHGEGVSLAQPATLDEALKVGGLNWGVGEMEMMRIAIKGEVGRTAAGDAGFALAVTGHGKDVQNSQCAHHGQTAEEFLFHGFTFR